MTRLLLWTAIAVSVTPSLVAGTIYSVTGPLIGGGAIISDQTVGVSWTQTVPYADVAISATVSGAATDLLNAYLTTKIGPGTTPAANEIADASIPFPGPSFVNLPLLNVPYLPSGTYYLTLSSSGMSGDLAETTTPSQVFGPGVTRNADYYTSNPGSYPPASNGFLPPPIAGLFVFSVTGTAVPEPAGAALVGITLITLLLGNLSRRRMTR